ncbi:MAG: DUF87 domain-containing protein [bacterium]
MNQPVFYLFGALSITFLVAFWVYYRRRNLGFLNTVLLSIRVPRVVNEDGKKDLFISEINLTEQLLASLSSIGEPFSFEVSVHHTGEQINFYLAVPRRFVDFTMRQVQGLFPDAKVDVVPDYTIFGPNSANVATEMKLRDSYILPIRTYKEAEVDTFSPIISTLSKLQDSDEGVSIQVILKPAKSEMKKNVIHAIEQLKKGKKVKDVIKSESIIKEFSSALWKLLFFSKKPEEGDPKMVVDDDAVKYLQTKINKQLFEVNVRLLTSATTKDRADDILLAVAGAFSQFESPTRNKIEIVKPSLKRLRDLIFKYSFREFDSKSSMVLNTEEIASLCHLPTSSTDVPRIRWLSTKEAPPPSDLPREGIVICDSVYRGDTRPVRMTEEDRTRHLYVLGQTGAGKTSLLKAMIKQDLANGKGICVMDPHGELVNEIMAYIPKERINDVIYFNPGDMSRPMGLNMLEYDFNRPEEKTFIVNEIQSIFSKLFSEESMGPMFQLYMRNALQLLMEDAPNEPCSLLEVLRLFTDDGFRERKLARIKNVSVIDFWQKQATQTSGDWSLANMATWVGSKFDNFTNNDFMRPVIGQTSSSFDFRKIMDDGKILLVNLSKGRIGDINSNLIGMIIIGKLLGAALSRQELIDKGQKDFRPFYLYIDEFQNYTTDSIETIFSEARKYKLCLTVAHQFIAQLEDNIREAVFGNIGSMIALRAGAPDTEELLKHFSPEFNEKDLTNFEMFYGAAKILVNGKPAKPFSIRTYRPESGNPTIGEKLKELSRLTYGRDREEVEQDIYKRLRG